jgi:lactate racemase
MAIAPKKGDQPMNVNLAYGKTGLMVQLPDSWDVTVLEPGYIPGLPDVRRLLAEALDAPVQMPPLRELVNRDERVGIVFSDITRPAPSHLLLPALLSALHHLPPENITLFNALGTHRENTEAELRTMIGDELVERCHIVQNNAFDRSTQQHLGRTSREHEAWLNRELASCDWKILTGFIEPHLFAGFSGGGKALMPGMAGQETVLGNHDYGNIAHPSSTWGITHGNPIWEEIREVALLAGRLFLFNVTLNKDKEITGVFAGELDAAHAAGCAFARQSVMVAVPEPFDIVITTNSGFPLDLNLYQAVKGMSAAAQIVRPGGAIVIAADCWDGIPEHGLYGQLLKEAGSPEKLLQTISVPGFLKQDQWQAQIQAQIQQKAEIYVYSDNLSDAQIQGALLQPCRDIVSTAAALLQCYGPQARICILPEGPQTIPYLAGTEK